MHRPTFVAAAFAAAVMSFAVNTADAAQKNPKATNIEKAAAKQAEPCPYLFGCSKKAEKEPAKSVKKAGTAKKATKGGRTKIVLSADERTTKHTATVKTYAKASKAAAKATGSRKRAPVIEAAGSGTRYSAIVSRYAASYGVPVSLAHAVIRIESNYRPNMVGGAGEIGLMQIKPATARMMGYTGSVAGLYNPETNIKFGMKYLAMAQDLGGGTTCGTILKYNAGYAAKRMNPVSSAYCAKVKVQMASLGAGA